MTRHPLEAKFFEGARDFCKTHGALCCFTCAMTALREALASQPEPPPTLRWECSFCRKPVTQDDTNRIDCPHCKRAGHDGWAQHVRQPEPTTRGRECLGEGWCATHPELATSHHPQCPKWNGHATPPEPVASARPLDLEQRAERAEEKLDQFDAYGITVASALDGRAEVERLKAENAILHATKAGHLTYIAGQDARIAELEKLLRYMDALGGLGQDVHRRISAALTSPPAKKDGGA